MSKPTSPHNVLPHPRAKTRSDFSVLVYSNGKPVASGTATPEPGTNVLVWRTSKPVTQEPSSLRVVVRTESGRVVSGPPMKSYFSDGAGGAIEGLRLEGRSRAFSFSAKLLRERDGYAITVFVRAEGVE